MAIPGPKVIKLCSCSSQLSMKFTMLTNVKMPRIVDILTSINMINTISESLKARKVMPIIVNILTSISMINTASESSKARKVFIYQHVRAFL